MLLHILSDNLDYQTECVITLQNMVYQSLIFPVTCYEFWSQISPSPCILKPLIYICCRDCGLLCSVDWQNVIRIFYRLTQNKLQYCIGRLVSCILLQFIRDLNNTYWKRQNVVRNWERAHHSTRLPTWWVGRVNLTRPPELGWLPIHPQHIHDTPSHQPRRMTPRTHENPPPTQTGEMRNEADWGRLGGDKSSLTHPLLVLAVIV